MFNEENIQKKLKVILSNPLISIFANRLTNADLMLKYVPEWLMILYNNERGKQTLIETGIYDFITKD